jgi:hypothetical protein
MIEYYLTRCCFCNKGTKQYISKTNRKRGVKLTCCECGKEGKRYTKEDLVEYDILKIKVEVASDLGITSNPKNLKLNQEKKDEQ